MPSLRPHDVAIALQLLLTPGAPYAVLAERVRLSQGEAHNAVRRLTIARLVRAERREVNLKALLEFLSGGVPYAFPAEPGPEARGVPTAHSAPPLARRTRTARDIVVWPDKDGGVRGATVEPLYPGAPGTIRNNHELYELLTLVDALRIGRARERHEAYAMLEHRLMKAAATPRA